MHYLIRQDWIKIKESKAEARVAREDLFPVEANRQDHERIEKKKRAGKRAARPRAETPGIYSVTG